MLERSLSNVADVKLIVLFDQLWFENEYMHIHGGERPLKYDVYTYYGRFSRNCVNWGFQEVFAKVMLHFQVLRVL